jgi:hypothetical protein
MKNNLLIEAIKSIYGFTTKEAKIYIKGISEKRKQYLIEGFEKAIKQSYYND